MKIIKELYRQMTLPLITEDILQETLDEIPIDADREYIRDFILNGQRQAQALIQR